MKDEILEKAAYAAYGQHAGWKNFRGEPMPAWDDLPEEIKGHWAAAADGMLEVLAYDYA